MEEVTVRRLRAVPDTLIETGPGRARAIGTVLTPDGAPWPGDPRAALGRVIEAQPELAAGFTASAELEFYLLDEKRHPIDRGGYFDDVEGLGIRVVRDAASQVAKYGIEIDGCHHEAGPGQYEIDIGALDPVALAEFLTDRYLEAGDSVREEEALGRLQALAGCAITRLAWLRADLPELQGP